MEICHVCGKEKKPYIVFLKNNSLSMAQYLTAREDGPICQKCDNFYALTGKLKPCTDEELAKARKANQFANTMARWWKSKEKEKEETFNSRLEWPGTYELIDWYMENES